LTSSYRFLVHDTFVRQVKEFLDSLPKSVRPKVLKKLKTQFQKSIGNPVDCGSKCMEDIRGPLAGKIFRFHVGGGKGYRFIYLVIQDHKLVVPVFVIPDPKSIAKDSRSYYEKYPWFQYASEFYRDLLEEKYDTFKVWAGEDF